MKADIGQEVQASHSKQHQLAQELVACLGREGAIHVCRVNGWAGVLDLILSQDTSNAD